MCSTVERRFRSWTTIFFDISNPTSQHRAEETALTSGKVDDKNDKNFMRGKFRQWYAKEAEKAVQSESESEDIEVKMRGTFMKEHGAKWLTAL